jgi:uncharacterized OsmC-like protein
MESREFTITLDLDDGYRFDATFDDATLPQLTFDEPPPLGEGEGPNAARVLTAAVGNCLSASLLHCLKRARVDVRGMRTRVTGRVERNEAGRLRVAGIAARLATTIPPEDQARVARCLDIFEDFCLVSASVRRGIPIDVEVDVVNPDEPVQAVSGVESVAG